MGNDFSLLLNFDGSVKKVDSKYFGAIGYFVSSTDRKIQYKGSKPLPNDTQITNTEAELQALIAGLEDTVAKGYTERNIIVIGDNDNIINSVRRDKIDYPNNEDHQNKIVKIRSLLEKFRDYNIKSVSAYENKKADEIAKLALNKEIHESDYAK